MPRFNTGDWVKKAGGDYTFIGIVVGVITKLSGATRFVVEDDRGLLLILNENQLEFTGSP